ncbi:MAG: thioredoxin family protein [Halothiobacillus sp.]
MKRIITRSILKPLVHRMTLGLIAVALTSVQALANPLTKTPDNAAAPVAKVMFVDNLTNIPADLAVMRERKIPMMIFFHASYCGYCRVVDDQFIIPMRLDPDFKDRLLIRRVQVDADNPYIGRDGQKHDYPYLANKLGVRGVPYVLFIAPDGSRITSIQGTAIDYYGYYLNKDINLATDCAKNPGQKFCDGSTDGPGL